MFPFICSLPEVFCMLFPPLCNHKAFLLTHSNILLYRTSFFSANWKLYDFHLLAAEFLQLRFDSLPIQIISQKQQIISLQNFVSFYYKII